MPRRAHLEAVDEDRLAVAVPSQSVRCRARSDTAKTKREGIRVAWCAVVPGARGRVLCLSGSRVSPAPLWLKRWERSGAIVEIDLERSSSATALVVGWCRASRESQGSSNNNIFVFVAMDAKNTFVFVSGISRNNL